MAGHTVQVRGIPTELPPDRVADKLTIHFLRSRNGGGEIADVQVLPGARPCALITFEALAVAQRILKAKNHVLSIGGKKYPLEVTAHVAELSPDEIFVSACMVVDYGKLPAGKTLLKNLQKGHSSVQLDFDYRNTHCRVKGPFTEVQAFSGDLLGSLNLQSQAAGATLPPGSSHVAKDTKTPDHQQVPPRTESALKTTKLSHRDPVSEEAAGGPSPRGPVDGEAVEQLEDFSLAMDSDIYLYMQRFCAAEYQGVLRQRCVDVVDIICGDITILYLKPSPGTSGDMGALRQARLALQQLYQQLEVSLRKEKISKRGLGMDSQALGALTRELQELYPELLCHEDGKQLYLIGNLVDVSQAKQYVQHFSTRSIPQTAVMLSSSQLSRPAISHATEAAAHKPKAPVDASSPKLSPGRPEGKAEHKLAANFSALKTGRSQAGRGLLPNRDSPPVGQVQLSQKNSSEPHALGPGDPKAPTQQHQPRVSAPDAVLGSAAAESQQNDPKEQDHAKGGARLRRHRSLSAFVGEENSALQHPGDSKGSDPTKHYSLADTSSTFQSLSLFDTTRNSSAFDSKPSESRPVLRRSNSFLLPKSKESNKPQDTARAESGGNRVSEEMSLDSLQWSYLKDVHRSAIEELCRSAGVQISERSTGDCTVLALQAEDRPKLLQVKLKVEILVQRCPDLVCQSMSYSELAIEGPDDDALSELCSLLRGSSLQVGLNKDKYKLCLACPKDMLPGVTEAFQVFSSRRLRALKSSSLSPGPERASSPGHPGAVQPSRSQDAVLGAALPDSLESLRMGLQHLDIRDKAEHSGVLRACKLPEAEEKRSPSPWRFPQAVEQGEANDHADPGAVQGASGLRSPPVVDNPSPGAPREPQEQPKAKVSPGEPDTARLKQVLPDKFQFARDRSRGGPSDAAGLLRSPVPTAEGAPRSLPARLDGAAAPEPPWAAAQQSPTAESRGQERSSSGRNGAQEEPEPSAPQKRAPSPGQESSKTPLGWCDACQDSRMTCQARCGHTLCRTCFAAEQPACCGSSLLAPSCKVPGTLKISTLSQSLPGYYRDLTLQLTYTIPDGVQGVGHPRPGQPYKGGCFLAFLPDSRAGQKIAVLLKKAFERGLTFQIKSHKGEEKVTWGLIPHKTSWDGGKARNGYPDAQYLQKVCTVLKNLGII